eukprot:752542-Hanusia_phi.AAC.9
MYMFTCECIKKKSKAAVTLSTTSISRLERKSLLNHRSLPIRYKLKLVCNHGGEGSDEGRGKRLPIGRGSLEEGEAMGDAFEGREVVVLGLLAKDVLPRQASCELTRMSAY